MFTKTFVRFFVGFLCIIGVAFAVMAVVGSLGPKGVDNVAAPR